jgi:hypothetical protein
MELQYKSVGVTGVKADDGAGVVTALVSVTGIVDNVSDIIKPGAYTKTLQKRIPKGVWHHSWEKSISKTLEIKELMPGDPALPTTLPDGSPWPKAAGALQVKMQFNLNTQRGREAYEDVKFFGDQQEWSIGYNVPVGGATQEKGIRTIDYLDLFEYSPVLFGAMSAARTESVKSAQEAWVQFKDFFGTTPDAFMQEVKAMSATKVPDDTDDDEAEDEAETHEGTDITDDDDGTGEGEGDEDGELFDDEDDSEHKALETPDEYPQGDGVFSISASNLDLVRKVQDAIGELLYAMTGEEPRKNPNGPKDPMNEDTISEKAAPAGPTGGSSLPMPSNPFNPPPQPRDPLEDASNDAREKAGEADSADSGTGDDDESADNEPVSIVQVLDGYQDDIEPDVLHQLAPMAQNFDHAIIGDDPEAIEKAADNILDAIDAAIDSATGDGSDALKGVAQAIAKAIDQADDNQDPEAGESGGDIDMSGESAKSWSPNMVVESKAMVRTEAGVAKYGRLVGHPTQGINYGVLKLTPKQTLDVSTLHPNSAHIYASMRHQGSQHWAAMRQARNVDKKRRIARIGKTNTIKQSSADFVARMEAMHKVPDSKAWENTVAVKDYDIDYQIKRQFTTAKREELGKQGHALKNPDGSFSFPIENEDDLDNAIQSIGRASDEEAAKQFIIKRAKDLNLTSKLPEDWMDGGSDDDTEGKSDRVVIDTKSFDLASLGVSLE